MLLKIQKLKVWPAPEEYGCLAAELCSSATNQNNFYRPWVSEHGGFNAQTVRHLQAAFPKNERTLENSGEWWTFPSSPVVSTAKMALVSMQRNHILKHRDTGTAPNAFQPRTHTENNFHSQSNKIASTTQLKEIWEAWKLLLMIQGNSRTPSWSSPPKTRPASFKYNLKGRACFTAQHNPCRYSIPHKSF